jgi:hypothetical protein
MVNEDSCSDGRRIVWQLKDMPTGMQYIASPQTFWNVRYVTFTCIEVGLVRHASAMFRVQTERIYELVMSRKNLLCVQNIQIIYTIHAAYLQ